ncbi:complex I NDUFA9 subunit family protein [Geoalkalibacter halelectricus]|uniref:Complex I NDUFA9 subunit family protein n=1 Tax=Geoalkalibacter halelectricus TaxID=2847045 RepID=A0ABY5ZGK3_9BACT|nr:complex I NDUFA9 subunit family protein [Geoalkalibacter halelectricus]MDO3377999.1 complex I NDUFA9 subunit family protein [Geoalkalibacter halelectricus]UWZ78300.1 complex I NDUFA9 subunit family protein [Geoalkalibacter halelectricus]
MKVYLTGSTGFVGREVLHQLLAAGHTVRCLVRPGSEGRLPIEKNIEVRLGDVTDAESLAGSLEGCDAAVHLVGIIREFPGKGITFQRLHTEASRNLVAAAEAQGIRRYLHMSANGTRPAAESLYHQTKWQGEEAVRASTLEWTIFRPSLIFGPGDEFVNMLADLIRKTPVVPVIGDGRYQMAPVAVEDVAAAFVAALDKEQCIGQTYPLCGPQAFSYDEILDLVGAACGKPRVHKLHHPVCLMKPVIKMLQGIPQFPITSSQLTMLLEGNVCDGEAQRAWNTVFAIEPKEFAEGIRKYLT